MLKRKIYDKLIEWKNSSNGTTALLIEGARRIGKSFIVEEFGLFIAEKILRLNRFEVLRIWDTVIDGIVIAKLALAIVVVLLNYVFCKFFVFKSTTIK